MARKSNPIPTYPRHSSGQARVRVGGRDILLGQYNSKESRVRYAEIVAQVVSGQWAGRAAVHSKTKQAGSG